MTPSDRRPLSPRCPAATIINGTTAYQGILCGVLAADQKIEDDPIHETEDWNVFMLAENPSVVLGNCCSRYETCVIWQSEKDRIAEQRQQLKLAA